MACQFSSNRYKCCYSCWCSWCINYWFDYLSIYFYCCYYYTGNCYLQLLDLTTCFENHVAMQVLCNYYFNFFITIILGNITFNSNTIHYCYTSNIIVGDIIIINLFIFIFNLVVVLFFYLLLHQFLFLFSHYLYFPT